jgi:hypothetical protein
MGALNLLSAGLSFAALGLMGRQAPRHEQREDRFETSTKNPVFPLL